MPRGTRHALNGILLRGEPLPVLSISGGGEWRLDIGWRTAWRIRRWYGRAVQVTGDRDGFDILAVTSIDLAARSAVDLTGASIRGS